MMGFKGGTGGGGGSIYRLRKADGVTKSTEKQRTSGTIGAYAWYCLYNGSKGVAYIQVLSKRYSKSNLCLCSDPNN